MGVSMVVDVDAEIWVVDIDIWVELCLFEFPNSFCAIS